MGNKRAVSNTIYYHDEQNDEFSGIKRQPKFIADDYCYINNNIFFRIGRFFVYRVVMTPVAFLYMKFKFPSQDRQQENFEALSASRLFHVCQSHPSGRRRLHSELGQFP
jgi:hypothetical protein